VGPLSLAAAVRSSLLASPSAAAAQQRLYAAASRLNQQLGLRYPQYALTTSASAVKASGFVPFATIDALLSVPLDTAGRNGALIDQARADLEAARWQYQRAQADLAYNVAAAFFGLMNNEAQVNVAADALSQAQAQQAVAQQRFDAGDVPRSDVLRAQVQVAHATSDELIARSAAQQGRSTLNNVLALGLANQTQATPPETPLGLPVSADQIDVRLLQTSPEIGAAREAVLSAEAALRQVTLDSRPQVSLQGGYAYTGDPTTYPHALSAGVVLSIPLPDGGIRRSRVDEARSNLQAAQASLDVATRQAQLDLTNARLSLEDAIQREAISQQGVLLAQESLRAANTGYTEGVAPERDVLDAQVALRAARIQALQAQSDHNLAAAKIASVLGMAPAGVPLPPPPPMTSLAGATKLASH